MTRSIEIWLWIAMRVSSMVLALAVTVHLVTMIVVIQGGLSADEILARTHGSIAWYGFYAIFVVAASVHGAIGMRNIVREHTRWRGPSLDMAGLAFAGLLLALGLRAIQGLFG